MTGKRLSILTLITAAGHVPIQNIHVNMLLKFYLDIAFKFNLTICIIKQYLLRVVAL